MAALQFLDLPVEIIRHICSMFCFHCATPIMLRMEGYPYQEYLPCSWQGLNELSQTCRLLCDIAQPMLYHHIPRCDVVLLLRTLLARPDLAAVVRSVSNEEYSWTGNPTADDIPWIEAAADRAGITVPPVWHVASGEWETHVIEFLFDLALAHVPHIEALHCVVPSDGRAGRCLRGPGNITFPSLRCMLLSHWDTEGGFRLSPRCEVLKRAPNLQSLTTRMCYRVTPGLSMPSVTSLSFEQGFLTDRDLENALTMCPRLEDLSYDSGGGNVGQYSDALDDVTPIQIIRTLTARDSTLKRLYLDPGESCGEYMFQFDRLPSEDDQSDALTHSLQSASLSGQPSYLRGAPDVDWLVKPGILEDLMRRSLVFIRLDRKRKSDEAVQELLRAVSSGQFPKLKQVAIWTSLTRLEGLKHDFGAVGVECRLQLERTEFGYKSPIQYPGF
jgi:hypothetical protein